MKEKTYKDFVEAFYELKKNNYDISYGRIAQKTGILEATINALANRRRAHPPSDEVMEKIAECFNLEPDYFYEWRLKRFMEFLNENRDFLDFCQRMQKSYISKIGHKKEIGYDMEDELKKEAEEPPAPPKKESSKSEKKSMVGQPVK